MPEKPPSNARAITLNFVTLHPRGNCIPQGMHRNDMEKSQFQFMFSKQVQQTGCTRKINMKI